MCRQKFKDKQTDKCKNHAGYPKAINSSRSRQEEKKKKEKQTDEMICMQCRCAVVLGGWMCRWLVHIYLKGKKK